MVQKDLFVAKLTSNDKAMDFSLAERTAKYISDLIVKDIKEDIIKAFENKIKSEGELFKLKNIIKNIEDYLVNVANGTFENPFTGKL